MANPIPNRDSALCVCILTPPGRGAVATVAVRGAGAARIVGRRFFPNSGQALDAIAPPRTVVGRFQLSEAAEEELVVGLVGADEVEIHCHGGEVPAVAIQKALMGEGCVPVPPQEWLAAEGMEPLAADALLALADARTQRTAAILLDQYRGALAKAIEQVLPSITQGDYAAATERLNELLARAELGLHLTRPWSIVLAGRPNAGKSSLLNALLGYERAIVFPQPGTTRDVLAATTALEGWPVELFDTAGLRDSGDALEAAGVSRARTEIEQCDLVLLVIDAAATAPADAELLRELQAVARRLIVVHNKSDLISAPLLAPRSGALVSAKTGGGIEALCQSMVNCLIGDGIPPGAAVPFTASQVSALRQAQAQLAKNQRDAARQTLENLLHPIDHVFSIE